MSLVEHIGIADNVFYVVNGWSPLMIQQFGRFFQPESVIAKVGLALRSLRNWTWLPSHGLGARRCASSSSPGCRSSL